LKDRAHELKGMAGNFGLKAVSEKAGEMEKMCKQDTIESEDAIPRIEEMET
jgi:HPt (histidine-containing phosphotransfer) domain-containing protein